LFADCQKLEHDEQLFIGNSDVSKVEGQGKVTLKWASGKELALNKLLHVPDILRNLITGSIVSKNGFKMIFEYNKFILIKVGCVGKGYLVDGFFKANVAVVEKNSYILVTLHGQANKKIHGI